MILLYQLRHGHPPRTSAPVRGPYRLVYLHTVADIARLAHLEGRSVRLDMENPQERGTPMMILRRLIAALLSMALVSAFAGSCSSSSSGDDDCRKNGCPADQTCTTCRGAEKYICLPKNVQC